MIYLVSGQFEHHKANAIDKRAIYNLISHLQWEVERDGLNVSFNRLNDESNYRIIKIDGYENIAFYDDSEGMFLQTIQPIDRKRNILFPIQVMENRICYKIY